jgi:D-arabinose 1-dehydrogenase-like Zn-dependent alcohol dehydrogenase
MRAIEVAFPGGPLELVERALPEPASGEVRIKVHACGVCHSDEVSQQGWFSDMTFPVVPGHEVAGVIDALGEGVAGWSVGDRVGVGWYGGYCGVCARCRRGDFTTCQNTKVTGVTRNGGYADAMLAQPSALVRIPDDLSDLDAAPLLCAGIATFNGLRRAGVSAGDVVAIQGVGGLGHLAVQFAAKMGLNVAAIDQGRDREGLALELGARHYIDARTEDVAQALAHLGGAKAIVSTIVHAGAMSAAIDGLTPDGKLIILGVPSEDLHVTARLLLSGRSIQGSAGGTPVIETMPLERAAEAYALMISGKARFRMVLTMDKPTVDDLEPLGAAHDGVS